MQEAPLLAQETKYRKFKRLFPSPLPPPVRRLDEGRVTAAHLGDYKLPNMADTVGIWGEFYTVAKAWGRCNVKGIGALSNVPTTTAMANAVAAVVSVRIEALPITAEKVFRALSAMPRPTTR